MGLGFWELAVILAIVLILFGAGKLPRVMGDVGKGIRSLKEGLKTEETPTTTVTTSPDKKPD
jgi:sec-independent protein translocase protein TatA